MENDCQTVKNREERSELVNSAFRVKLNVSLEFGKTFNTRLDQTSML